MKKSFIYLSLGILASLSFASKQELKKSEASGSKYLVTNHLERDDLVMFTSLSCSPSEITGGYLMEKDEEKGYTTKKTAYSTVAPTPTSSSLFTVCEGSEPNSFAFKLGKQFLRADTSTPKFLVEAANIDKDFTFTDDYVSFDVVVPYLYNTELIDLTFTINGIVDGSTYYFEIGSVYGTGDDGYIILNGEAIELSLGNNQSVSISTLSYYGLPSYSEVSVPSLSLSYFLTTSSISIKDPTGKEETLDKEASWTYSYDKNSGLSYLTSCLNNKNLCYDNEAGKFKLLSGGGGIDIFFDTTVNVANHTPTSISIDKTNVSTTVTQGESYAWTSLVVNANYSGGVSSVLPLGGYDITTLDTSTTGTKTITVSFMGKSASYNVTVNAAPVVLPTLKDTLEISGETTEFIQGQDFIYPTSIVARYSDNSTKSLSKDDCHWDNDNTALLTKDAGRTVVVRYQETINGTKYTAEGRYKIYINPIPYVLTSISAKVNDDVTFYDDEVFAKSKITVTGTYVAEGYENKVSTISDYEVTCETSLSSPLAPGNYTLTISVDALETTLSITVVHKPVRTGYEITAEDGYVGTTYDAANKITIKEVFDTGAKADVTDFTLDINSSNEIKNSKMPKEVELKVKVNSSNTTLTKTINLTFAPVSSFELKYTSSKDDANVGDTQQIFIKKVNSEPTLESTDWLSTLSERQVAYLDRFTFSSENTSIASVSSSGLVTYLKNGKTNIVVTPKDGSAASIKYAVSIGGILPESVSLNKTELVLNIGKSEKLVATVLPSDAKNKAVTFTSSNPSIASVDNEGNVKGLAEGTSVITVTTVEEGLSATCNVTVTKSVLPESISLNSSVSSLYIGETTQLSYEVNPVNAEDKSVSFTSSSDSVATVSSSGLVTAKAEGEVIITVSCNANPNVKNSLKLQVNKNVSSIRVSYTSITLDVGNNESKELKIRITPTDAFDKSVVWSSSDSSVASVDQNGLVTSVGEGKCTITVSSVSNPSIKATCEVTVINSKKEENSNKKKKGCFGAISAQGISLSFISIALAITLILRKKKSI